MLYMFYVMLFIYLTIGPERTWIVLCRACHITRLILHWRRRTLPNSPSKITSISKLIFQPQSDISRRNSLGISPRTRDAIHHQRHKINLSQESS